MNEIIHYFRFKNSSKNWEMYVFHWEKCNFERIGNFVHIAELLALGKALNFYINYLMFYQSRQHVKFYDEQGAKFM